MRRRSLSLLLSDGRKLCDIVFQIAVTSLFFMTDLASPGFVACVPDGIFRFAECVLDFTLGLIHCAFSLKLRVASPFANLAFHASLYVFHFSFDTIFVHNSPLFDLKS